MTFTIEFFILFYFCRLVKLANDFSNSLNDAGRNWLQSSTEGRGEGTNFPLVSWSAHTPTSHLSVCKRILSARKLARHLGFGNCGGMWSRKFAEGVGEPHSFTG